AGACGSSKKEINSAKHSLYDTDFAVVYSAALAVTRELYPQLDDNPGPGRIATSWHQVQYANCAGAGSTCDDQMANQTVIAQQQGVNPNLAGSPNAAAAGMPTRLAYKRYFIRFDVHVLGGRPWRVKVTGHASSWDPGAAMPVEMKGADKPHWLEGRSDALTVAIYKKIKQYAIPMKEDKTDVVVDEGGPKTDPNSFKNVPIGAAKELAAVKDVLAKRDYTALRPLLAEDVVWSLGGGTGADAAMAMWQADPSSLEAMNAALASCTADGNKVTCGAAAGWQLIVEPHGADWRVTSFVKAE
ncbi:MAG TPA: nuclear transport factor 2 family protein, partial [Kofleriaceae bacterium]